MFRQIAILAVPVMALALTTGSTDNAFAKGGHGGHGGHAGHGGHRVARHHGGTRHNHRHDHRGFGSRFGSYGYFGYEAPVLETEVVYDAQDTAVVATDVDPVYSTVDYGYAGAWGRDHFRNHRHEGHRGGHGGHRGGGRRR